MKHIIEPNVDPVRVKNLHQGISETGIYVRAKYLGRWGSYDIAVLDAPGLLAWLRSRGGKNEWAENCVGMLLGHEKLVVDGEDDA